MLPSLRRPEAHPVSLLLGLLQLLSFVSANTLGTQLRLLIADDELLATPQPQVDTYADGAHPVSFTNAAAMQQERRFELQRRLNYDSIQRMLRDEHDEQSLRREDNELRYLQKRHASLPHELHKRELQAKAVTQLNLSNHQLISYDSGVDFHGEAALVHHLDLSNNRLIAVRLPHFSQLYQLDVSNNSLSVLPATSATLVSLDLACNQFSQLTGNFFAQRMPQLKHLNLAHNQLGSVARETFFNLLNLQTLLLSGNNITDIDYETFLALPNLQYLDLSHNRLGAPAIRALQGIPDLMSLSIAYNPQVGAAMQEFVASWSLKELDASGTGLCQVPAALAQSVRTLKLTDNWLKLISCGDLDSYPLLQYLDLSHSRIARIEDDALGRLELLATLFLDHNLLMQVPASLPTSLEHLFLQNNRIMELQPQTFATLSSLKTLDLSGNQLLYLPALPLPKLLTLNLQSAGVESVSQAIVHTLPQLRDLMLDNNPIKCSDLLGIAEWASPCRSTDANQPAKPLGKIDLKQQFVQLHNFYENFKSNCGQPTITTTKDSHNSEQHNTDDVDGAHNDVEPANCGQTTVASGMPTAETMPKVNKSKAAATVAPTTMQSNGNNIALLTTKTLRPTETTSLAKLQQQQMPGMPTAAAVVAGTATTTTARKATITTAAATAAMPSLGQEMPTVATAAHFAANHASISAMAPATKIGTTAATSTTHKLQAINSYKQMQSTTRATTTSTPLRLTVPTKISNVAATTTTDTPVKRTAIEVPQTILELIKSDKPATPKQQQQQQQQQQHNDNVNVSLLKRQTTERQLTAAKNDNRIHNNNHANGNINSTSGQLTATTITVAAKPAPAPATATQHKHATLQLHIKDRHLIGTPLLMHKGDNLLVDAEQLLLPGTATVADARQRISAATLLDGSQLQPEPESDKRQPDAINVPANASHDGDTKLAAKHKVVAKSSSSASASLFHKKQKLKPSLTIKKMTYSTKHAAAMTTKTTTTTTTQTTATYTTTAAAAAKTTATSTGVYFLSHQHSSVNTPNAMRPQHELSTFAQLKAYAEPKTQADQPATEASKSAQLLLDTRQQSEGSLAGSHPGLVLLVSCVLVIVLLAGLAHIYRCELPWQRRGRHGQARPHHQRQFNESDDAHSFLHYAGQAAAATATSTVASSDPARLHKWHHSTRREAPYSSPLHNLHVRELQREQEKLRRCQQFYSASLSVSGSSGSSSRSSHSSLLSPTTASVTTATDETYYIEMAPSSSYDGALGTAGAAGACLPMELLATSSLGKSTATQLGGTAAATTTTTTTSTATTTLKAVSSKLMAPSSRRLGIW